MYNIMNESEKIELALKYYMAKQAMLITEIEKEIKKDYEYKFYKLLYKLFGNKDLKPMEFFDAHMKAKYWFGIRVDGNRVDGINYNMVKFAIRDLQTWREAIERRNAFTIDERSYKDFLNYIKK